MWKRETLIVAPRFQVPDRGATKHIIIYGGFSPAGAAVGLELAAAAAVVPKKEPSVLSTYPQKADKKFLKVTDVTSLSYIYIYIYICIISSHLTSLSLSGVQPYPNITPRRHETSQARGQRRSFSLTICETALALQNWRI